MSDPNSTPTLEQRIIAKLKLVHSLVKEIEPWGILVAVIGFGLALWAFWMEQEAREEDRINRALSQFADEIGRADTLSVLLRNEVDLQFLKAPQAYLPSVNLDGVNLFGADLQGAILVNVSLKDADLSAAVLNGVNLSESCLKEVTGINSEFRGSILNGAKLMSATLIDSDFRNAELRGADLSHADLSDADLSNTDLRGATLAATSFVSADLTKADFTNADLTKTDFSYADLTGATLVGPFKDAVFCRTTMPNKEIAEPNCDLPPPVDTLNITDTFSRWKSYRKP